MGNIVNELVKIHNENFKNKVGDKYFSEMMLGEQYEIYCLFNFGEENIFVKKLENESEKENKNLGGIYCILWYNREHGYFWDSDKKRISKARFWWKADDWKYGKIGRR